MKRTPKPAERRRAGYPRLAAAWRIALAAPLLAAGIARADATVPGSGDGNGKGKEDPKPQPQKPTPPPRDNYPILGGAIAAPDPPRPPDPPKKKPEEKKPHAMVLHPHAPGEPCFPLKGVA